MHLAVEFRQQQLDSVAGQLALEGVSCDRMLKESSGESVLMSALQASVADTAGTSPIPRLATCRKQSYLTLSFLAGCDSSQVTLEAVCDQRRSMSIRINFVIALESESLGTSALTSMTSAVNSGALAASFTVQAANRNEVVSVATAIVSSVCTTCGVVVALITDDKVAGTT